LSNPEVSVVSRPSSILWTRRESTLSNGSTKPVSLGTSVNKDSIARHSTEASSGVLLSILSDPLARKTGRWPEGKGNSGPLFCTRPI
jgi:hypothetical protein